MMDIINKATKLVDHNRGGAAGVLVLVCSLMLGSCANFDGKAVSTHSGQLLNSDELRSEYVQTSSALRQRLARAQVEIAAVASESDRNDAGFAADLANTQGELEARNALVGELGPMIATGAGIPWLLPLITIGTTALAGGVGYDNRRKDKVIREKRQ